MIRKPVAAPSPIGPTMLYRAGTAEKIHGVYVDWIIVEANEVDAVIAEGWYRTPAEAKEADDMEKATDPVKSEAPTGKPTKEK